MPQNENERVRRYDPGGPRASRRDLGRLDALMALFRARGVLDEYTVWLEQQRKRPDYAGGLSGSERVAWVRSAHPELLDDMYRVIDAAGERGPTP